LLKLNQRKKLKMDKDMIIALANAAAMGKPADGWGFEFDYEQLELFAKLVAAAERKRIESRPWGAGEEWIARAVAAEREACAKVAENGRFFHDDSPEARFGKSCAAAIRARGQE
jgi:hypothetical protein